MKKLVEKKFIEMLRAAGLRATEGRISLLALLSREHKPLSVDAIQFRMSSSVDTVTIYRSLEALENAGIVTRSGLGHDHAHYELATGRPHHHHAVCVSCGTVEDVEISHGKSPEKEALKAVKGFATMSRYSLEFFGTCKKCV